MKLAVLTAKLEQVTKRPASQLGEIIRMFQPEAVLRWHRELVCRKWTEERKLKRGRPRHSQEVEGLMVICAAVLQTRKTDNFSKTKVLCL